MEYSGREKIKNIRRNARNRMSIHCKQQISKIILAITLSIQLNIHADNIEDSVIKIFCASQSYIYNQPWKNTNISSGRGTGFIISDNRIITNAHVVSDAKYIEVQKFNGSGKYIAKVEFIAHGSDLAILKAIDPTFYKNLKPLSFGDLPKLNTEVTTYGYPLGGNQLSVTRGVVSRIEMHTYSHSGIEQHMTIQTDAAINPGNSGGPVIQNGKVAGIAFQGLSAAENVGYLIPSIVVQQFLDDIKDGKVDGFSDLAISYREDCQNPSIRKILGLPKETSGVLVTQLFPNTPAWEKIKKMDVILSINDLPISNDGFIKLKGRKLNFQEVVERLQVGNTVHLKIFRDKKIIKLDLKTKAWKTPINQSNPYGVIPKYYIFGGLAFTPLSKGYISSVGSWKNLSPTVRELYIHSSTDEKYAKYQEFPVLTVRLPHRINVNMDKFVGKVVYSINDVRIYSMKELKQFIEKSDKEFIEIRFLNHDIPLIISKKDAIKYGPAILTQYHISSSERL